MRGTEFLKSRIFLTSSNVKNIVNYLTRIPRNRACLYFGSCRDSFSACGVFEADRAAGIGHWVADRAVWGVPILLKLRPRLPLLSGLRV